MDRRADERRYVSVCLPLSAHICLPLSVGFCLLFICWVVNGTLALLPLS
jgi:hypothetical protein